MMKPYLLRSQHKLSLAFILLQTTITFSFNHQVRCLCFCRRQLHFHSITKSAVYAAADNNYIFIQSPSQLIMAYAAADNNYIFIQSPSQLFMLLQTTITFSFNHQVSCLCCCRQQLHFHSITKSAVHAAADNNYISIQSPSQLFMLLQTTSTFSFNHQVGCLCCWRQKLHFRSITKSAVYAAADKNYIFIQSLSQLFMLLQTTITFSFNHQVSYLCCCRQQLHFHSITKSAIYAAEDSKYIFIQSPSQLFILLQTTITFLFNHQVSYLCCCRQQLHFHSITKSAVYASEDNKYIFIQSPSQLFMLLQIQLT